MRYRRFGIYKEANGYYMIYAPFHPSCTNRGFVRLHRAIMEYHIGRYLTPTEIVHHKNGDIHDNRLENLEVITRSDHIKFHKSYLIRRPPIPKPPKERRRQRAIYEPVKCKFCNGKTRRHSNYKKETGVVSSYNRCDTCKKTFKI